MKKMFLLFSHQLTPAQKQSAVDVYDVEEFIYLPQELQKLWSGVPTDIEELKDYLSPLKIYLDKYAVNGDIVLVQGDFGAVYHMVNYAKQNHLIAFYATTKRITKEYMKDDKTIKESIFEFERFREYE